MNIQVELSNTGGTYSEQCLITKALDGAIRTTRLKKRV